MSLDPSLAAVRNAVRPALAGLAPGAPVVVACSGGADSLALLGAAVFWARRARERIDVRVLGVCVDHGLQDGSAEHTARVVEQMAAIGADETLSARVQVQADGWGLEAAAREARYAVLEQVAASVGAAVVLLGHTRDDQAETVLMGLSRGSGARSLAGMRRGFDVFARPLLDVDRAQTETACRAEGVAAWSDPHNDDPRFLRSRVRHEVLPLLAEVLNPRVREALARTADLVQADLAALEWVTDGVYAEAVREAGDGAAGAAEGAGVRVDTARLRAVPEAVLTRVLRRAAVAAGARDAELAAVHVQALARLAREGGAARVQLPGHRTAVATGGELRFERTHTP